MVKNKNSKTPLAKLTERLLSISEVRAVDLREIQSEISLHSIVRSQEPVFLMLQYQGKKQELGKTITGIAQVFLQSNFPEQVNNVDIALNFAAAIMEREPSWELGDVVNFFKMILIRQDTEGFKVYGNRITALRLMEMVPHYALEKAIAHEQYINERNKDVPQERHSADTSIKALMGKALEKVQIRDDGKKTTHPVPDEKFFGNTVKQQTT